MVCSKLIVVNDTLENLYVSVDVLATLPVEESIPFEVVENFAANAAMEDFDDSLEDLLVHIDAFVSLLDEDLLFENSMPFDAVEHFDVNVAVKDFVDSMKYLLVPVDALASLLVEDSIIFDAVNDFEINLHL